MVTDYTTANLFYCQLSA